MKLHGWCEKCKRYRVINVGTLGMMQVSMGAIPTGVCSECEAK